MSPVATQQHWIETPHGQLFAQSWSPAQERGVPVVLLHDSLGCVALWRDFPERLAQASGRRVIAYDRLGFGRSTAHPGTLALNFVQDEALGDFQAVCQQLELTRFAVMGHSVGGGMAVGCAAAWPQACEKLITESAQAFVEERTLEGIRNAKSQFAEPGQLARLQRYHGDKAEWVLRAWTNTWLSAEFSQWNLAPQLSQVHCPLLSLHGDNDEFGSTRHPEHITALAAGPTSLHVLPHCGHVPHREQADAVLTLVQAFLAG